MTWRVGGGEGKAERKGRRRRADVEGRSDEEGRNEGGEIRKTGDELGKGQAEKGAQ